MEIVDSSIELDFCKNESNNKKTLKYNKKVSYYFCCYFMK